MRGNSYPQLSDFGNAAQNRNTEAAENNSYNSEENVELRKTNSQYLKVLQAAADTNKETMKAINTALNAINSTINTYASKLDNVVIALSNAVNTLTEKVTTMESNIGSIESNISGINSTITDINSRLTALENSSNEGGDTGGGDESETK